MSQDVLQLIHQRFGTRFDSFEQFLSLVPAHDIIKGYLEGKGVTIKYGTTLDKTDCINMLDAKMSVVRINTIVDNCMLPIIRRILRDYNADSLCFFHSENDNNPYNKSVHNITDDNLRNILPALGVDYKDKSLQDVRSMLLHTGSYDAKYLGERFAPLSIIVKPFTHDYHRVQDTTYYSFRAGQRHGPSIYQLEHHWNNGSIVITVEWYIKGLRYGPSHTYDVYHRYEKDTGQAPTIDKWWLHNKEVTKPQFLHYLQTVIIDISGLIPELVAMVIDYEY